MKRLFFINRYFFPDHSATSQILSQLAFHMAETGHDVHVLTTRQLYDNPDAALASEEVLRGVAIHRLASTSFGRSQLLTRGLDYLSFYTSAWRFLNATVNQTDVLIPMTDPPLLSILGMRVARKRGCRLINWLQDIYPEIAVELDIPLMKGPLSKLLAPARNASLRSATENVVVGEQMAKKLSRLDVARTRINIIPNWCDDESIVPVDPADNPLREEWGLQNKFVLGYSGNLGRAHEFETVLGAADRLRNRPEIAFLFIGGGHRSIELARNVKARGLFDRFLFLPYQSEKSLKFSLSAPDVHWVSLRPELEGLIVPSKFYGIAAAGRPVIAVTASDGEIAQLVIKYNCGVVVEPGNVAGMTKAIDHLAGNRAIAAEMGRQARAMLDNNFTRHHAFKRWNQVLDKIT